MLSLFFQKKSRCPAIKWKRDALIEMKLLRKTPRNDARKSYEASKMRETQDFPETRSETTAIWNDLTNSST